MNVKHIASRAVKSLILAVIVAACLGPEAIPHHTATAAAPTAAGPAAIPARATGPLVNPDGNPWP